MTRCGACMSSRSYPPDVGRLLVTVAGLPGVGEDLDPSQVIERLQHASGRLRCAVAAAITRRRSPVLDYRFALPGSPARSRPSAVVSRPVAVYDLAVWPIPLLARVGRFSGVEASWIVGLAPGVLYHLDRHLTTVEG